MPGSVKSALVNNTNTLNVHESGADTVMTAPLNQTSILKDSEINNNETGMITNAFKVAKRVIFSYSCVNLYSGGGSCHCLLLFPRMQQFSLGTGTCSATERLKSVRLNLLVPQGSVLGPVLISLSLLPLWFIFKKHRISFYCFDSQIYLPIQPNRSLLNCLRDHGWS